MMTTALTYRVAHLGLPASIEDWGWTRHVEWTEENLLRLKDLGFNTVQLNVAWGARPGDEPLNLEDVVTLTPEQDAKYPQPVPLRGSTELGSFERRRSDLRTRIELCRKLKLRTIFHFGAPYNAHAKYGDNPPNCISDPALTERHALLIQTFAREFPGVDDLLLYTYDQDAWLCSEFGNCPRCSGVPLSTRLVPFLARLTAEWQKINPQGRLWWEPWELSAGQSLRCAELVPAKGFGLSLHSGVGECMTTLVADRWFRNLSALAASRGIPVLGEYFLGGGSEETEPLHHLAFPLVILRALKALSTVPGVTGIKEYYGVAPDREDPNLRMAGVFFAHPEITEDAALSQLAEPYGTASTAIQHFWRICGDGMEIFPWEVSWFIREIGRSAVDHALTAAYLRGQQCSTPSWDSTRHSVFMKVDNNQPHPWMLEDVELRCRMAAERWAEALNVGRTLAAKVPELIRKDFTQGLDDLARLRRRAVAYACHLRETNLATVMRRHLDLNPHIVEKMGCELLALLNEDRENWCAEIAAGPSKGTATTWPEMDAAISDLGKDARTFLKKWLLEVPTSLSKGPFSLTSR
jgi:hypothetical protein